MDADSALPKLVARTATEEELGKLLDHMDEWRIESEVGIEACHGEWVATLTMTEDDPRRGAFATYLADHPDDWTIDPEAELTTEPLLAPAISIPAS